MDLNDLWNIYFHDPGDKDWTLKSYVVLSSLSTVDDFWVTHEAIGDKLPRGMFFVMREHVFPCWDDPENKQGGCFSLKVPNDDAIKFWESLCASMLGEVMTPDMSCVNGASISPKRDFCIVKIWVAKASECPKLSDLVLPTGYVGDVLFKPWWE